MEVIKNIAIIFTSIFFESLPFLLLGALISAVIETFVSNETICKLFPKNKVLGSLVGVFLGLFLPACDCAVIPVSKRLLKKKVPINAAVSFMMASPIINPVVLLSTYYAFYKTNPSIFYARIILGIIIALLIGVIMGIIYDKKEVVKEVYEKHDEEEDYSCCSFSEGESTFIVDKHHDLDCSCHKNHNNKFFNIIHHTAIDMFEVVKYLMFGALIASLFQTLVPRSILVTFNNNNVLSVIILMIFAYLISLCSTSDSFVGRSLMNSFTKGSIIAYLLLGPMIDIKNTLVLLGNFKKKFVITLISLIFILIFICSILVVSLL